MTTTTETTSGEPDVDITYRTPTLDDGSELWRIARDSQVLDLNTSYSYLLWCRDFSATSVVATVGGDTAGFVTGYLRPERPDAVMVWQVAVDAEHRGRGLGGGMLDHLVTELTPEASHLEATIAADNEPSIRLFSSFAESRGATVQREPVFESSMFPDDHEDELLFRIGPLG